MWINRRLNGSYFDTSSFIPKSDDVIKLDNVDKSLSKEMMIEMNKILKRNTSNEDYTRYNARGFKVVPNIMGIVNVIKTSEPKDVEKDIDELLTDYLKLKKVTHGDIIDFHVRFENSSFRRWQWPCW